MDIRLIDRARTVTVVPTKDPRDDPWGAMAQLAAQADFTSVKNHQVEFVMDKEFMTALEQQTMNNPDIKTKFYGAPQVSDPSSLALQTPTFNGIPIVVTGE